MIENLKKYFVELIGVFFLVLTIACTGLLNSQGVIAPLAIASILTVMIYAGGHISGGHYNPAVSLAAAIRGVLEWKQFAFYSIFQIFGGVLAVLVFQCMASNLIVKASPALFDIKGLLIAEFLFTFALCYVVLQTATTKNTANNSYYGFAIGFTVLAGAFAVGGSLCAGAFNPAVALSIGILNIITFKLVLLTILANLAAGASAAVVFKFVYNED